MAFTTEVTEDTEENQIREKSALATEKLYGCLHGSANTDPGRYLDGFIFPSRFSSVSSVPSVVKMFFAGTLTIAN
jgi:hypothetical protein